MAPRILTHKYSKMIDLMCSLMKSEFHRPGDFVVKQNDLVQVDGKFLED